MFVFLVESATISISPLIYEVLESDGAVGVVVTKTGSFLRPIQGTLTTTPSTASGKMYYYAREVSRNMVISKNKQN